jgi:hypothetical protein
MSVYTVHEPPLGAAGTLPDTQRFAFVRDGFSFWAFIASPWWMLWHRLWLVLLSYVVITVALIVALAALGASAAELVLVGLLIALLVGLEASTLRRLALWRRGWRNVGIVSGHDVEDAERRFFDSWLRRRSAPQAVAPAGPAPPSAPAPPRAPRPPEVIGLFPEPGGRQ